MTRVVPWVKPVLAGNIQLLRVGHEDIDVRFQLHRLPTDFTFATECERVPLSDLLRDQRDNATIVLGSDHHELLPL